MIFLFKRARALALAAALLTAHAFSNGGEAAHAPSTSSAQPGQEYPVGWRGDGTGGYQSANPVTHWSTNEHIRWKVEVGAGQSSPVVVGQRVFITAEPDLLLCLDRDSGKERWRKTHQFTDLPAPSNDPGQSSQYGDMTPTPVSDGTNIWVFVGTGIVACYDMNGARRWITGFDLPLTTDYGRTASPVLVGEYLLIHPGPLVCLNAATGKLVWKNDAARAAYGTPARARIGDCNVVVTPKGDIVRVTDGKILATDLGNCLYTSPVVQNNVVYFIESDITAVQLPDHAADQIRCQELWSRNLGGEFYASPVVGGTRIYTIDKGATYYVIDAKSGKTILSRPLEFSRTNNASAFPSLCLAGKFLFIGNDAGEMRIVDAGDAVAVPGTGSISHGSGSTATFSGKQMFIRGGKLLYCIAP
jgi:outer membrane protein assembly factor BamB